MLVCVTGQAHSLLLKQHSARLFGKRVLENYVRHGQNPSPRNIMQLALGAKTSKSALYFFHPVAELSTTHL